MSRSSRTSRARGSRPRLWVAGIVLATSLAAGAQEPQAEEKEELQRLLAVMQEETAVATQTRMNADYVPGIVTVLHGEELEALGARNVLEALALVPGVQSGRDLRGLPVLQVRGVDTIFNNGGVRVLVDSRTLSREDSGLSGATLLMPIERVERLEVIRGPGAGVWGNFAFACLVNIVTRRDRSGAFVAAGSRDLVSAGVTLGTTPIGPFQVSGGAAGFLDGDERADAHPEHESRLFGNASVSSGGFSLTTSALARDRAGLFRPVDRIYERSVGVDARYAFGLSAQGRLEVHAGYLANRLLDVTTFYDARRIDTGLDLSWQLGGHRLLFSGSWATSRIDEAWHDPPPPAPRFGLADLDEDLYSVIVQDELALGGKLTVTGGLRWDRHENLGNRFTPRIAAVLRLSDSQTLKAQWAEGFRAPSFFQLYAGGRVHDLGYEGISTAELGWIYRRPSSVGRVTVYLSRYTDILVPRSTPPPGLVTAEARSTGIELEWTQSLTPALKAVANLSLADTEDERDVPAGSAFDSFGEARWLWNLALVSRLAPGLTAGARWSHVGTRSGVPGTGQTFAGYDLLDLTLTLAPASFRGLSLRVGARNLLGEDQLFPIRLPGATQTPTYDGTPVTVQAAYGF